MLVTETEGALPPPRRRRRRARKTTERDTPVTVSVSVVTLIRADQPFENESAADLWLDRLDDADHTGDLLGEAIGALDRVRAADAAASGIPFGTPTVPGNLIAARIGYGEGELVASGRFLEAREVDARGGTGEKRRQRLARTGPMARTAEILGGREPAAACEVLVPRIRLDLENGNEAAARLAIAGAAGVTISELEFAVDDDDHERDLDRLEELLPPLAQVSARAESGGGEPGDRELAEEALELAERVIRRRRILGM